MNNIYFLLMYVGFIIVHIAVYEGPIKQRVTHALISSSLSFSIIYLIFFYNNVSFVILYSVLFLSLLGIGYSLWFREAEVNHRVVFFQVKDTIYLCVFLVIYPVYIVLNDWLFLFLVVWFVLAIGYTWDWYLKLKINKDITINAVLLVLFVLVASWITDDYFYIDDLSVYDSGNQKIANQMGLDVALVNEGIPVNVYETELEKYYYFTFPDESIESFHEGLLYIFLTDYAESYVRGHFVIYNPYTDEVVFDEKISEESSVHLNKSHGIYHIGEYTYIVMEEGVFVYFDDQVTKLLNVEGLVAYIENDALFLMNESELFKLNGNSYDVLNVHEKYDTLNYVYQSNNASLYYRTKGNDYIVSYIDEQPYYSMNEFRSEVVFIGDNYTVLGYDSYTLIQSGDKEVLGNNIYRIDERQQSVTECNDKLYILYRPYSFNPTTPFLLYEYNENLEVERVLSYPNPRNMMCDSEDKLYGLLGYWSNSGVDFVEFDQLEKAENVNPNIPFVVLSSKLIILMVFGLIEAFRQED